MTGILEFNEVFSGLDVVVSIDVGFVDAVVEYGWLVVVVGLKHVPQHVTSRLKKLSSLQEVSLLHAECGSSPKTQVSEM